MACTIWDNDAIDGSFKMENENIFQKENKYLENYGPVFTSSLTNPALPSLGWGWGWGWGAAAGEPLSSESCLQTFESTSGLRQEMVTHTYSSN